MIKKSRANRNFKLSVKLPGFIVGTSWVILIKHTFGLFSNIIVFLNFFYFCKKYLLLNLFLFLLKLHMWEIGFFNRSYSDLQRFYILTKITGDWQGYLNFSGLGYYSVSYPSQCSTLIQCLFKKLYITSGNGNIEFYREMTCSNLK